MTDVAPRQPFVDALIEEARRRAHRRRLRYAGAAAAIVLVGGGVYAALDFSGGGRPGLPATPPGASIGQGPRTAAQARAEMATVRGQWLGEITSRGSRGKRHRRPVQFANLDQTTFLHRLRLAGEHYHFAVKQVLFYRPLQLAPLVVIRSNDPHTLSRDTGAIVQLLDPHSHSAGDLHGWAYEGFLLEAQDARGVPFLAVFKFLRGSHAGGGQWASQENLFPFPHG